MTADTLPPLETVSADGIATSDIPPAVAERVMQALEASASPKWWGRITFGSEPAALEFVKQARAYCEVQEPVLSFRRQTVFVPDPSNDADEVNDDKIVQFRVTVKNATSGRAARR